MNPVVGALTTTSLPGRGASHPVAEMELCTSRSSACAVASPIAARLWSETRNSPLATAGGSGAGGCRSASCSRPQPATTTSAAAKWSADVNGALIVRVAQEYWSCLHRHIDHDSLRHTVYCR